MKAIVSPNGEPHTLGAYHQPLARRLKPMKREAIIEGRIDMGGKVIINIKSWVDGHNPPDHMLPSML